MHFRDDYGRVITDGSGCVTVSSDLDESQRTALGLNDPIHGAQRPSPRQQPSVSARLQQAAERGPFERAPTPSPMPFRRAVA